MTNIDPDHVDVLAKAHHATDCLPAAAPGHRWNQRHLDADSSWAKRFAAHINNGGYTIAAISKEAR